MSLELPHFPQKFQCNICYHEYSRKDNLKRHMLIKHQNTETKETAQNGYPTTQNGYLTTQNGYPTTQNGYPTTQNGYPITQNGYSTEIINQDSNNIDKKHRCPICDKTYNRQWCVTRHIEKCKGNINKYKCEYCNERFTHAKSRFRHYKTCIIKKDIDSKALVVPTITEGIIEPPKDTMNNHTTNNNTINNNINTVGTQNNIQNLVIVYNQGNTEFKTHHLDDISLQRILQYAHPEVDRRVVTEYTRHLLDLPENQCIRKDGFKTGSSDVHLGKDEWETRPDRSIYPGLACNVANNMSDYLYTKRTQLRKEVFEKLIKFMDYMSGEGYINTDDREKGKKVLEEYKLLVKEIKCLVYSRTKKKK
jgi:transcriptional regulator NrdR family protein